MNQSKTKVAAQPRPDFMAKEVRFNSVELELARRWAFGEVPPIFVKGSAEDLRRIVKAWWQIYHESAAAASGRNRTVWERNPAYPADALDTTELIATLQQIEQLMDLETLARFRAIHQAEHSAIGLLKMITAFYVELSKQTPV